MKPESLRVQIWEQGDNKQKKKKERERERRETEKLGQSLLKAYG